MSQRSVYTLRPLTFAQWRALGITLPHDPHRWRNTTEPQDRPRKAAAAQPCLF